METGTGKTYVYTHMMYLLNELYGFNKFVILVPSAPIKEGTKNFIQADYSKRYFNDLFPNVSIELNVLNAQKNSKGKKMFPSAVADYARESIEELYCAGVINGVGGNAFAPTENCTRAQAAKIIYEAFAKQ